MLSSLSTNHIQAALFTTYGLSQIVPEVMSLSVPFQIRDDAELDLVLASVLPILEEKSKATNFVVLTWSRAGWLNLFSKDIILEPNDLRKMRLATSGDAGNMNSVFRGMGFNLVEVDIQDIGPMLANGTISAVYSTPAAIAPIGLHRTLNHMLDMPIAPFLGAVVMNRITWDRLGPQRQQAIMDVTRRMAVEFDRTMPRTVENAVTMMRGSGLSVQSPTPQQREMWRNEVQTAMPPLLGNTFDRDMFSLISSILERSRSRQ
jgi:TRAP-type C4-dicarboxylate transport system substrate-binding protein